MAQRGSTQVLRSLVNDAKNGSVVAFTEIVRRFQDMVVGYAYSVLGDFHLAEDAAQETFVEAYLDLPSLQRVQAFTGWLRKIAYRRCLRLTRGKEVPTDPMGQRMELVSANPGPEEIMARKELRDVVNEAIRELPQREREVTTLLYINGYSQKEVGDFLEIATGTVRSRLHAARKKLRERMVDMVEETLREQRPSKDEGFLERVTENLPSGTVTFLFTDIEGSTSLWQQYPEAMKTSLARHDEILRGALESNGGYVFKTIGDAFCAAFSTAPDAIDAIIKAQTELGAEEWGEMGAIKIRAALHTGATNERGGDYYGTPVNRAARLLSAGHGGQTLLSIATYELVRDALPDEATLTELGVFRLKDLIRPERVFQLTAPGLITDFPLLKTLDLLPNNLPLQSTPFIGREREVVEVKKLLSRSEVRLLTLTGPGGTGKTRLGLQVAADLLEDYRDGVFFCALTLHTDWTLVVSAIAQALGVRESEGRPIVQSVKEYLCEKNVLIILDNFEQVASAAPQVAELLEASPGLNLLATSRAPLHIRGEYEYPVPPLAIPDLKQKHDLEKTSQFSAVALFIERAQAIKPDFAVTNENAPAVAQICVRLDGLPLAIELAAARIKLFTPQAMLKRLKKPLKFLTGGAIDVSARQQTLRGAVAWSYDLLNDEERMLFRQLGIFAGGWTIEAADAVCAAREDVRLDMFEGLGSLADKNLLRQQPGREGEPRFLMLETIREFALERLTESEERVQIEKRHAEYFLALAEQGGQELRGHEQLSCAKQLEIELDNFRAAMGWAEATGEEELAMGIGSALTTFWCMRGHSSEGYERLERLVESPRVKTKSVARAKALCMLIELGKQSSNMQKLVSFAEESVSIMREIGDQSELALSLFWLGATLKYRAKDVENGTANLKEALAIFRAMNDKWGIALALSEIDGADLDESLALYREIGDRYRMTLVLGSHAWGLWQNGDPEAGSALFQECAAIYDEMGDLISAAQAIDYVARIEASRGNYESAATFIEKGLKNAHAICSTHWMLYGVLWTATVIAAYQDDDGKALAHIEELIEVDKRLALQGVYNTQAAPLYWICDLMAALHLDYSRARSLAEECIETGRGQDDTECIANGFFSLGRTARFQGDEETAGASFASCLELTRGLSGADSGRAMLYYRLARVSLDHGEYAKAGALFEESIELLEKADPVQRMNQVFTGIGMAALYQDDLDAARSWFERAAEHSREKKDRGREIEIQARIGEIEYARGNYQRSLELYRECLPLSRKFQDVENVAWELGSYSRVLAALGDIPSARALLEESIQTFQIRRVKRGIAEGLAGFARLAIIEGNGERAATLFGAAETIHKIVGPRLAVTDHHDREKLLTSLRGMVPEKTYRTSQAEGEAMDDADAVDFALKG